VAIGPQNAFLLRVGASCQYAYLAAGISALCDLFLIALGSFGLGAVLTAIPTAVLVARWAGAAYLCYLGAQKIRQAVHATGLDAGSVDSLASPTKMQTVRLALGFAFLNPHVYIDTIGLMAAAGSRYSVPVRTLFVGGAATGSFLWFNFLVTVGALLGRWLEKAQSRRIFDGTVGLILFGSALWLAVG
jgi:L-lysine exporter family protein LysE/ArgO